MITMFGGGIPLAWISSRAGRACIPPRARIIAHHARRVAAGTGVYDLLLLLHASPMDDVCLCAVQVNVQYIGVQ